MLKIFKISLINFLFLILFLELLSFILIQLKIIPKYLPPVMSLHAHKEYSFWHPLNKKMTISSKCWISSVEFNDIGLKSSKNYNYVKDKQRIAILGDSMTENIQLSNEYDFASKLQSKLKNYEIINFSVASTGLADQIDIYNKLIKKFEIDYIFLFITENDFDDNYILYRRPNRLSYDFKNGKIIEYEREEIFFDEYYSVFNKWKRKYLFYLKDYSNSFKLYYEIKNKILYSNLKNQVNEDNNTYSKKIIYGYLRDKFIESVDSKTKLFVFFNLYNRSFLNEDKRRSIMKQIWSSSNYFDPGIEAIEYLKKINKLEFPYMGFSCDAHYSALGAEFLSNYVTKKFESYK
jgi:hypothetical protein